MTEPQPVLAEPFLAQLPPVWPDPGLRTAIRRRRQDSGACVVAFDDDPTGTQTVAGVRVLHRPTADDLDRALQSADTAFYILTNSRSLPTEAAANLTRSLAADLARAARSVGRPILAVSRSDSTLRGHFPAETDALAEGLGRSPATLLIPFFAEGGRFTIEDVHWVREADRLIPAAQTAFARDPVFGYRHSRLPSWVEEKSAGRIRASDVRALPLAELRREGPQAARRWLEALQPGGVGIVNAAHDRDLEVVSAAIDAADAERLQFRSAASWVKILAGLPDPLPIDPSSLSAPRTGAGLVIVGSVVPRTDEQLAALRRVPGLCWEELQVSRVLDPSRRAAEVQRVIGAVQAAWSAGRESVVYTTRAGQAPHDLDIGRTVSAALVDIVRNLPHPPSYIVAKGGITASDIATEALGMRSALVMGPVLPGVPVWQMSEGSRWPGLPLIVFPGNVGARESLAELVEGLRGRARAS